MPVTQFYKVVDGAIVVNIGAMRHQITLLQQSGLTASPPVFDSAGYVQSYQPFLTGVLAAIDAVRGTDVLRGGIVTTQLFLTALIWFQPGILPNMRVLNENGSQYVIQSIENVLERNEVLILNCLGLGSNE